MAINACDFLMGEDAMVIVVNGHLPKDAPNFTISATPDEISLKAGWDVIARIPYSNANVFDRLTHTSQIGMIEYEPPKDVFPNCITNMAYVQTMRLS